MVDSSTVVKGVENPATAHLLDKSCKPTVSEGTRVQFSFLLNSCGTTAKVVVDASTLFQSSNLPPAYHFQVDGDILTYENEIFFAELINTSSSRRYTSNYPTGCIGAGPKSIKNVSFFPGWWCSAPIRGCVSISSPPP